MDFATLIGLAIAWTALGGALFLEGGNPQDFVLFAPLLLVVGGTLGATCITVSVNEVLRAPSYIKLAMQTKELDPTAVIATIVDFARKARRDGILGLEEDAKRIDNPFMRRGIRLIVDGVACELIRDVMEIEVAAMIQRHKVAAQMMSTAGGYAPTMGIIGTVMGLVHMLNSLSEPAKMGPAIASAFLATLYGVMIANLFFLPIAEKLRRRSNDEAAIYEMVIEGVLAIQDGDNPRIVEMKMLSFLPEEVRSMVSTWEDDSNEGKKAA